MRPVYRGPAAAAQSYLPRQTTGAYTYQALGGALLRTLGEYCSYCEAALCGNAAVEHIVSKSTGTGFENKWNNLLLACVNCNSTKSSKTNVNLINDYLWPCDIRIDTFAAYRYVWDATDDVALVRVNTTGTTGAQQARATATLELVGLDRDARNVRATDRRIDNRTEAWRAALALATDLRSLGTTQAALTTAMAGLLIEQIVVTAQSLGFWSVWMTVFRTVFANAGMLAADVTTLLTRLFVNTFPATNWGAGRQVYDPLVGYTGLP